MSDPFIAEIRMWGLQFAPRDWAYCDGQILAIAENPALFSLISDIYGGNGQTTMGLPNLQGRAPLHSGRGPGLDNYLLGERYGINSIVLDGSQIPSHNHQVAVNTGTAEVTSPKNAYLAVGVKDSGRQRAINIYNEYDQNQQAPMSPSAISVSGGAESHENRQPLLVMNFCIALLGVYPSRN